MKSLITQVLVLASFSSTMAFAVDEIKNPTGNGVERGEGAKTMGNGVERGEPMMLGFYSTPANVDERIQTLTQNITHVVSQSDAVTREDENALVVELVNGMTLIRTEYFGKLSRGQSSVIRRESINQLTDALVVAAESLNRSVSNVAIDTLRVIDNPSVLPALRKIAERPENKDNQTLIRTIEHLNRLGCEDKLK